MGGIGIRGGIAAALVVLVCTLTAPAARAESRDGRFRVRDLTDCAAVSRAVRDFAASVAPQATAAQAASYGLLLPRYYDPSRRLVVLVHGLDCDRNNWNDMAALLAREGYQIAFFNYPSDQPIADSADLLARCMASLRRKHPSSRVDVVAHSMGGLVSRAYVEGPEYAGGVERLILIGPPNAGSKWAKMRLLLEADEHYHLWRHEPGWSPTWAFTDGLGEAGRDLKPGSKFLRELNARARRPGVAYTIVAGSQSTTSRVAADCLDTTAGTVRGRAASWWGLRHCRAKLRRKAETVRNEISHSDGPVAVRSARLAGVDDFVIVQGDHASLYFAYRGEPPAAWDTVRDRLSR